MTDDCREHTIISRFLILNSRSYWRSHSALPSGLAQESVSHFFEVEQCSKVHRNDAAGTNDNRNTVVTVLV